MDEKKETVASLLRILGHGEAVVPKFLLTRSVGRNGHGQTR
jgi:hypothetical protein